jgi:hypothetical protein
VGPVGDELDDDLRVLGLAGSRHLLGDLLLDLAEVEPRYLDRADEGHVDRSVVGDALAGATIPRGKPKANAAAPDGLWEALTPAERTFVNRVGVNFGKALAAYQRKLIRRDAPV